MTFFSRSDRVCRTESSCSWSRMKLAASTGTTASESSMKSPRWESSSSPIGVSSDTGSWEIFRISRTFSGESSISLADLLGGRLAAQLLEQLALDADQLVDRLDHVHRDADGAGLVGDGPGDGLADPPGGVGGELEALGVVELLHRPDQAQVALLDQVEEQHAPARRTAWRSTRPGAGWPRSASSWPAGRRARCASRSRSRVAGELAAVVGGLLDLGGGGLALVDRAWPGRPPARAVRSGDLADLLEVHPDRVVGGRP